MMFAAIRSRFKTLKVLVSLLLRGRLTGCVESAIKGNIADYRKSLKQGKSVSPC